jgi:hypothetical protein
VQATSVYLLDVFSPRYVDAVLTIPKGTLFPMCGMNLAFNRELIGPAMYFGLMGDGQPIGRYDDMWAGWCTKVVFLYQFPDSSFVPVLCSLGLISGFTMS